jgi:hypothetical protein
MRRKVAARVNLNVVAKNLYNQDLGRTLCLNCFNVNGQVKRGADLMKILHEPFRSKNLTNPLVSNALDEMAAVASINKELIQCINPSSLSEELNPLQVLNIFKNITKVSNQTTNAFAI